MKVAAGFLLGWMGLVMGAGGEFLELDSGMVHGIRFGHFKLRNGMEVAVVSDGDCRRASAVLELGVGTKTDPNRAELKANAALLGSVVYPGGDGIFWYARQHEGYAGVSAKYESVEVHLTLEAGALGGALDRLGSCFLDSAVPDEHRAPWLATEKSQYSDDYRIQAVQEAESNMFVEQEIKYSSGIMKLVVVGRESIQDQMASIASAFGGIADRGIGHPMLGHAAFGEEHLGIQMLVVPLRDIKSMQIQFVIPQQPRNYLYYIEYLLLSEADGSLVSELRSAGWIKEAHARTQMSTLEFDLFELSFTLDPLTHSDDILALVLAYFDRMREEIRPDLYQELQTINTQTWTFQEKLMPAELASKLGDGLLGGVAPRHALDPTTTFNLTLIQGMLSHFTKENMRVTLVSRDFATRTDLKTEPTLGVSYTKLPLGDIPSITNHLSLPQLNPFLANEFSVVDHPQSGLILLEEGLYYHPGLDSSRDSSKVSIHLGFQNPTLDDCLSHASLRLLREMIWLNTRHLRQSASRSGVDLEIHQTHLGISFHLIGFSQRMELLIRHLCTTLKRDLLYFDRTIHDLNSKPTTFPVAMAANLAKYATVFGSWGDECVRTHLNPSTPLSSISDLKSKVFFQGSITTLVAGNLSPTLAQSLSQSIKDQFQTELRQPRIPRSISLPIANSKYQLISATAQYSAIEYYVQLFHKSNLTARAIIEIIVSKMHQEINLKLCKMEELCSMAVAGQHVFGSMGGIRILFMSTKHPNFLEERIDTFLLHFQSIPIDIPTQVHYILSYKYQTPSDLRTLATTLWNSIQSGVTYDDPDIKSILPTITSSQIHQLIQELLPTHLNRRKLSIHIVSPNSPSPPESLVRSRPSSSNSVDYIPNLDAWREAQIQVE